VNIILASTSPIRKTILQNAGVRFESRDPQFDEENAKQEMKEFSAAALAQALASAKSISVSLHHPQALVIGADQTLGFNDSVFNKPRSIPEARQQLLALRNRTHNLYSALSCSIAGHSIWNHCDLATLSVRDFSDAFLDHYIAKAGNSLLSSVGGYKLEEYGINLFKQVTGDYFTILGLPLLPLLAFLRQEKYIPS
jgi:septum formation protein